MNEPFREPAEIIPRVDAKATMDRLEAAEPAPFRFRLATTSLGLYAPSDGEPVASPTLREIAKELHFTYFGRFSFVGTLFERMPREIWIDEKSGTVMLTLRRATATGVIEKQMSQFNLETMFDAMARSSLGHAQTSETSKKMRASSINPAPTISEPTTKRISARSRSTRKKALARFKSPTCKPRCA
jgi:hypothetical protein